MSSTDQTLENPQLPSAPTDNSFKSNDHWSPSVYTSEVAPFVAQLTTRLISLLAPSANDDILDLGCGDGVLTAAIATQVRSIVGIDSSAAMLSAVPSSISTHCCSVTELPAELKKAQFSKVMSNAALHWILAAPSTRVQTMAGVREALKPSGKIVAELGGASNIAEVHAALLGALWRRGIKVQRGEGPWWFPNESEMKAVCEEAGLVWEHGEMEMRMTELPQGGVEGWVRLFGAWFLERVKEEERDGVIEEVVQSLEPVCRREDGRFELRYVRLRFVARRP